MIAGNGSGAPPIIGHTPFEEPVDVVTGVAANTPVVISPCREGGFYADYALLYVTPRGGGGNTTLTYVLSAHD